ncbi:MAG: arginase, partial [Gaiellales bacterium]|nr:arginase [Gaiellales bacterium]
MSTPRRIALIGVPLDLGQGRRGVDMGPSAIRYAGIAERLRAIGYEVEDRGDVAVPRAEAAEVGDGHAKYLEAIVGVAGEVASAVEAAQRAGDLVVVLGGDHSLALGVFAGLARASGRGAAIWLDAHADCNTPATSLTGNVHGMPLAVALGWGDERFAVAGGPPAPWIEEERSVIIGARDLDPQERVRLRASQVAVHTMTEIDRHGMERVVRSAIERVQGAPFVHVSLDLDVVDPQWAPGVGTPVRGGISFREAHLAVELLSEAGLVGSLQIVEVNPILDRENATGEL